MTPGGRALSLLMMMVVVAACTTSGINQGNPHIAAEDNAQLGLAYMQQGNDELAMQKLLHALELDANSADAHHYLAQLYMKLGKNSDAEEHYRKALSLTPSNPMLLNNYGVFLCRQRRMNEAQEMFLSAVRQPFYKTPEEAFNNAGVCALIVADTAKAEEYFREALQANPKMPQALYELADLKFKQQKYLNARAFLQRYLDVAPISPAILWLGVRVERDLGDGVTAAKYAKQLQEKFPNSQESALLQGKEEP